MALETGSYVADLVVANPDGSVDPVSQGDDHLRLIKTVLKNTFPNMGGVFSRMQLKTAGYTVATTDNQSVIRFTGAGGYTVALPAVAGLYSGFGVQIVNDTSGTLVFDPNASETINGATTLTIPAGFRAVVWCDASAFYAAVFLGVSSAGAPNIGAAIGTSLALTAGLTLGSRLTAGYRWNSFNPSDVAGTLTNAGSSGTAIDADAVSMANSSGTLTITFDYAGTYLVTMNMQSSHSAAYSTERGRMVPGGTATRLLAATMANSGDSVNDLDMCVSSSYLVTATAGQTLTVLPTYELTGSGTTSNHSLSPLVTVTYLGG